MKPGRSTVTGEGLIGSPLTPEPGARRFGDANVRLVRLDDECDHVVVAPVGAHRDEVDVIQPGIAGDAVVADGAVERARHLQSTGPVLGHERRLQGRRGADRAC